MKMVVMVAVLLLIGFGILSLMGDPPHEECERAGGYYISVGGLEGCVESADALKAVYEEVQRRGGFDKKK